MGSGGVGEWGVVSGEWGVGGLGSGEWGVGSGEWEVGSGEWGFSAVASSTATATAAAARDWAEIASRLCRDQWPAARDIWPIYGRDLTRFDEILCRARLSGSLEHDPLRAETQSVDLDGISQLRGGAALDATYPRVGIEHVRR